MLDSFTASLLLEFSDVTCYIKKRIAINLAVLKRTICNSQYTVVCVQFSICETS